MRFLAFLLLVSPILHQADFQGYLPQVSPFFFLCNYHGNVQELGIKNGEVRISVAIEGNPDNYVPRNFYKITVTSSLNFDAFLLTGLYSISDAAAKQVRLIGIQAYQPVGLNLMCSIVHSHISMQPVHHFSFIWIAPPSGTGCVSFLATATLGQQILFKDITVLQLCEFGAPTQAPLRPALAEADSDHVIFRDDFDSSNSFAPELWSLHNGATVSDQCGTVMFGKSALFCEKSGVRSLETQPLNTTSAHALSFALSAGTCGSDSIGDQEIVVSVALNGCTVWHELDRIRSPTKNIPEIHLVHLPPEARDAGVCFAWKQAPTLAPSIVYIEPQSSISPPLPITTKRSTQRYTTQKYTTHKYTTPKPFLTKTTKRNTQRYTTQKHTTPEPTTLQLFTDHSDDTTFTSFLPTSTVNYDYGDLILHDEKKKPQGDEPLLTSEFGGAKKSATKIGRKFADVIKKGVIKKTVDGNAVESGGDEKEEPSGTYQNCWAVDNVLIVNLAHTPSKLEDNFDPMDPSEWTFFPGAQIKQKCHSENNAMVFDNEPWLNGAVTRPVNLTINDYQMDIIMEQQFESKSQTGWVVEKGHVDVTCGIIHSGNSVVFDGPGKSRRLCTPYMDTRKAGNVRFHFGFGSGKCHASDSEKTEVLVFVEDANDHTLYIIEKLQQSAYKEPRMVSLPLQPLDRQLRARICWLQKYNGGTGQDVWAIDNVQVLPHLPSSRAPAKSQDKTIQFSINMNCGNNPKENEVSVEYSNNLGGSWYKLHGSCLPGQCEGEHFPTSSEFQTKDYSSWQRVTLPIPYAAQTPYVWFRIKQSSQDKPTWALDNVYIGDCPEGCNNHGKCEDGHCICDFGHQGPTCKESVVPNPTTLMENFEGQTLVTSSVIKEVQGAELNYDCDVLSMGKALVFNQDFQRMILTAEINTTNNMYLQYNIRVGSNSPVSKCPAPDHSSEVVVLDYSCNGGMTWKLLKVFSILDYRKAKSESVMLPNDAQDTNCQFRWWQPVHSGQGHDVWALDDLSLNNHLYNTLNLEMGKMVELGEKLAVTHGKLTDSYCRKMKSLSFLGEPKEGDERSFMTESMLIGPSYIMQFDLVMGCGLPYSSGKDNKLYLEYSKDHGIHWNLVEEPCLPPMACNIIQPGTVYEASQYPQWTRITIRLPSTTWGPGTRFRIRQSQWGPTDTWAIARLYIGQQCPSMCFGHGECVEGRCVCDEGFYGDSCQAGQPLDNSIQADFGIRYEPETDFLHVRGGKVVNSNEGCGTILSGESLYFFENGVRELQTKDMDTTSADVIQFYIKIGGQDKDCNGGDQRSEGVLLQYSNDGGITWNLLEEIVHDQYQQPKFVKVDLPPEARSRNTRFRWWQPSHSGKGHDQWSVDEIQIGRYENLRSLEDNFDNSADPQDSGVWSITSDGVIGKYCQSGNPTLILANQEADKIVMTKDLRLQPGDIIQFKINVGCNNQFRWDHPVMFQYIQPGSDGWKLVHEPCYQEMDCQGKNSEGTIYYSGPYGHWELVVIPVPDGIISQSVMFRWWQPGGYPYSFALDDVYIGPPCKDNCNRHGVCRQEFCACDRDFKGPSCQSDDPTPYGMVDRFEQHHRPSDFWKRILGGDLGVGCGTVDSGNGLYFDGEGTREAVTVPLNTANLRVLQFVVKIGSKISQRGCSQPESRNEGIIVDFSTDNEVTWEVLKMVEPHLHNGTTEVVSTELPPKAKNMSTIFRWWQPLGYGGMPRAEWGLDSVIIGVNDTNLDGFQDDFSGFMPDMFTWFQTESAVPRITCNSKGNALEFSRNGGQRYAETWDYHVTPSTFLQFDIAMGCDSLYGTLYSVMLEYSVDMGKTWHPVVSECKPPNFECSGYHLSSMYMSDQYRNWTRISVYLPPGAVSPATRFRWHQQGSSPSGNVWALDNVYLGDGCPWLCSGHGYCKNGRCVCDEGFGGEYCVPEKPLPMMLRDDFNREKPQSDDWGEIYGGDTTDKCGHLISGNALTFHEDHLRMAVTKDIDTSMLNTIEFYFLYGCNGGDLNWPRKESVLLQYSKNGGITWNLLKELHYRNESGPRFFSLELPVKAKYNATRFRFWQPANSGKMLSTWAIDNLFIGRMPMNPSMMEEEFETDKLSDSWLFVNDGEKGSYCESNTREDTVFSGESALVFLQGLEKGEHSVVTRDLDVGPMSVLQFDINVGCASDPTAKYPVRLEYSADGGKTWALVVPNCASISTAVCHDTKLHSSIYYGGTSKYWRRIIIPLDHIYMCGSLRFRWYQGFIPSDDYGPEWAIDNVFIGMACMEHCLGQGSCQSTMMCECDSGHHGDKCIPSQQNSNYLKEAFTLVDEIIPQSPRDELPVLDTFSHASHDLDEKQWEIWSGGVISGKCGTLVSGTSLYFGQSGERMLVTKELDLSKGSTVQFWLRLGCQKTPPDPANPPVFLQYTTNGGVAWNTIEQFDFNSKSNKPFYAVLHLPEAARSNATQLRWWQPSTNGSFVENWALDQIYIGGDVDGTVMLSDEPQSPLDPNWLLWPGGTVEPVCGSIENAIHFNDDEDNRYAVSADVVVEEGTFLQFDIALGCEKSKSCYGVHLEFSLDMGTTWKPVYTECLPSDVACTSFHSSSILMSDVYTGWNRVTIPLPYYTRSKDTRFRWQQKEGFNPKDTWAVVNLYIGKNCHGMCRGHGRCTVGGCLCDSSWQGEDCSIPVSPLPKYLYDTFNDGVNLTQWSKVMGAKVTKVCKVMPSGQALHFAEDCTRMLVSTDLDLREAVFVQFYFLYGCNSSPVNNDQNVVVDFSNDGGITWHPITQMYYQNYRSPAFITVKLPQEVKENGVRLRWWQPTHGKNQLHDWAVDNINIGGNYINPENFSSIPAPGFDPTRWYSADNLVVGEYCNSSLVAKGDTLDHEASTLTTRDLNIKEGYMLQFSYNIGCMHSWNATVAPLYLQYSTDYGMTWSYVVRQCLSNDPRCKDGATMASVFYGDPMGRWQREIIPLEKMVISSATRFRWQQLPYEVSEKKDFNKEANYSKSAKKEVVSDWAVKDIYIGPRCEDMCQGHGVCNFPDCVCDEGYSGQPCRAWIIDNPRELKDTFDEPGIDKSKWQLVQSGEIQAPCTPLVEGTALVMNGPGIRQIVTTDMDLRDAKFIQYHASLGGSGKQPGCIVPTSRDQDVILQYSTNGGITWHSLHTLDHTSYHESPKHDYILLPQDARTPSTRIRWWQPLSDTNQPQWALDNVYIGGHEINPSQYQIGFNETQMISDQPWEFHPFGQIETQFCLKDDKVMYWEEGKGPRQFITKQMIVQTGYIIQFKIAVGCRQHYNACVPVAPIRLEFNNVPNSERWDLVQPLCLPDHNMRMDCRPNIYHHSSIYTPDSHPVWTRVTLELPEKTYSSGTRFRLIQESLDKPAPAWALDDVYVGENCPSFCHGRGDCKNGVCVCDKGYGGKDCMPLKQELVRMLESFEGGIFPSHWSRVSGGGIGFGCGALLPFAHGKTLYFNGCGLREAKTVPMDLSRASKVMFVVQIGCHAQTPDCNVVVGNASQYRGVLLQYSTNNDAEWHLIARHDPADYLSPKRLAYDLPAGARSKGTQLRWWQPVHDGEGTDQWALDNVEIIPGRNGINMHRYHNKREAFAGR